MAPGLKARRILLLALTAAFLPGTTIVQNDEGHDSNPSKRRYDLELYIYQFTALLDTQIEEISEFLSEGEIQDLRAEFYTWKIERDVHCSRIGRTEPGEFRELECLEELTEAYYIQR